MRVMGWREGKGLGREAHPNKRRKKMAKNLEGEEDGEGKEEREGGGVDKDVQLHVFRYVIFFFFFF